MIFYRLVERIKLFEDIMYNLSIGKKILEKVNKLEEKIPKEHIFTIRPSGAGNVLVFIGLLIILIGTTWIILNILQSTPNLSTISESLTSIVLQGD